MIFEKQIVQQAKLETLEWHLGGPAEDVENSIFIRVSPQKRVPQIFPASVCATGNAIPVP